MAADRVIRAIRVKDEFMRRYEQACARTAEADRERTTLVLKSAFGGEHASERILELERRVEAELKAEHALRRRVNDAEKRVARELHRLEPHEMAELVLIASAGDRRVEITLSDWNWEQRRCISISPVTPPAKEDL